MSYEDRKDREHREEVRGWKVATGLATVGAVTALCANYINSDDLNPKEDRYIDPQEQFLNMETARLKQEIAAAAKTADSSQCNDHNVMKVPLSCEEESIEIPTDPTDTNSKPRLIPLDKTRCPLDMKFALHDYLRRKFWCLKGEPPENEFEDQ